MARFRKKPIVIDAVQWTGKNIDEVRELAPESVGACWFNHGTLQIKTPEGDTTAMPGDYIIKGVRGECYPCKPDIFALTYEPLSTLEEAADRDCSCTEAQQAGDDPTLCPSCTASQELELACRRPT